MRAKYTTSEDKRIVAVDWAGCLIVFIANDNGYSSFMIPSPCSNSIQSESKHIEFEASDSPEVLLKKNP